MSALKSGSKTEQPVTISINNELRGVETALRQRRLSQAIDGLDVFGVKCPELGIDSKLGGIRDGYRLMADYWRRGLKDGQINAVYDDLLRRAYSLFADVALTRAMSHDHFTSSVHARVQRLGSDGLLGDGLRNILEGFVSDAALICLEPEHTRAARQKEFYTKRQRYMNDVFDCIWTSGQWNDSVCVSFTEIAVSPTVDTVDQQLIVSAVTIGAMNMFDANKLRMLADTYRQATDERVRQRALVGLALALNNDGCGLFPEVKTMTIELLADTIVQKELAELQIQLLYCLNAENDNETIQRDIMPDLLKRSNMHITPRGLDEKGDDSLRDILDPEAAENDMEAVEASFRRMADMQKAGADVYFGGFSQMKRFPFFDCMSNWFVPFYKEHPSVSAVYSATDYKVVMRSVLDRMPFCDSDKYSFVMAFQMVVGRIPQEMKDLLNKEGVSFAINGGGSDPNAETAAYIRRSYLQDLYRFFRLFPSRGFFSGLSWLSDNGTPTYLFFANQLFCGTLLSQSVNEVASFLFKRKQVAEAAMVLANYSEDNTDYQYYMLCGGLAQRGVNGINLSAKDCFAKALEQRPGDTKAQAGYARACFSDGDYATASAAYERLVEAEPDNRKYALGYCVCLTNTERYDEALALLYRMDYEHAGDCDVNRIMARALMGKGNCLQALKIYEKLGEQECQETEDLVNHGYCQWFLGNVSIAARLFAGYLKMRYPQLGATELGTHIVDDIISPEYGFIMKHGVGEVEIYLMADEICAAALR